MTEISGQAAWLAWARQKSPSWHLVEGRRYVLTLDEKGATVLMSLYDAAELAVRRAS